MSPSPKEPSAPSQPSSAPVLYIVFTAVIDGAVDSFDQQGYLSALAAYLSIALKYIDLKVASGSVTVEATIRSIPTNASSPDTTNAVNLTDVADKLHTLTTATDGSTTAANAVLGVTVLSSQLVEVRHTPPPPPPSSPTTASPSSTPDDEVLQTAPAKQSASSGNGGVSTIVIIFIVLASVILLLGAVALYCAWHRKRFSRPELRKGGSKDKGAVVESRPVGISKTLVTQPAAAMSYLPNSPPPWKLSNGSLVHDLDDVKKARGGSGSGGADVAITIPSDLEQTSTQSFDEAPTSPTRQFSEDDAFPPDVLPPPGRPPMRV